MDLTITTFESRKAARGKRQQLTWEAFVERMSKPVVTPETFDNYQAAANDARTAIKDVGGYVGGTFAGGKRSKAALQERCILTVDADEASYMDVDNYSAMYDYKVFCHTTHSSSLSSVRLRWVFPLTRPVNSNEYRVLIHVVADWVGESSLDDSTDQPERLMFWPSVSKDQHYSCWELGSEFIDPDVLLNSAEGKAAAEAVESARPTPSDFVDEEGLQVPEGHRNKQLFSFAASLRQNGLDEGGIRTILAEYNDRYCYPPVDDWELDLITSSVCTRYSPGEKVAPSLRDAWDDFADLGTPAPPKAAQDLKSLDTESLLDLVNRYVPEPRFVVEGVISEGSFGIVGPPKKGKSWMSFSLGIAVATGTPFLGWKTNKCDVLILCLEDSAARVKKRMLQLLDGKPVPDNIYYCLVAPSMDGDLFELLDAELAKHPDIGLIIIDTFQKIRSSPKRGEGAYAFDYRDGSSVHNYGLQRHVAVTVVHHTSKGEHLDLQNNVSGTQGVIGTFDGYMVINGTQNADKTYDVFITNRDMEEDGTFVLARHGCRWENYGRKEEYEEAKKANSLSTDPAVKAIVHQLDEIESLSDDTVDQAVWECTATELLNTVVSLYGESEHTATTVALGRHIKSIAFTMAQQLGIQYEYKRAGSGRKHCFTRSIE